jgi:hypothetical protein
LLHTNSPNGCIRQMPVNRCSGEPKAQHVGKWLPGRKRK